MTCRHGKTRLPARSPRRRSACYGWCTPLDDEAEETEGGDPVCWAHLVCDECGAITSEGHRAGCAQA